MTSETTRESREALHLAHSALSIAHSAIGAFYQGPDTCRLMRSIGTVMDTVHDRAKEMDAAAKQEVSAV